MGPSYHPHSPPPAVGASQRVSARSDPRESHNTVTKHTHTHTHTHTDDTNLTTQPRTRVLKSKKKRRSRTTSCAWAEISYPREHGKSRV